MNENDEVTLSERIVRDGLRTIGDPDAGLRSLTSEELDRLADALNDCIRAMPTSAVALAGALILHIRDHLAAEVNARSTVARAARPSVH
jgi:hypothetical protein